MFLRTREVSCWALWLGPCQPGWRANTGWPWWAPSVRKPGVQSQARLLAGIAVGKAEESVEVGGNQQNKPGRGEVPAREPEKELRGSPK